MAWLRQADFCRRTISFYYCCTTVLWHFNDMLYLLTQLMEKMQYQRKHMSLYNFVFFHSVGHDKNQADEVLALVFDILLENVVIDVPFRSNPLSRGKHAQQEVTFMLKISYITLMQQTLNPFTDIKILFRISLYFVTFRGFPQFHKFVIGKSSQFSTVQ